MKHFSLITCCMLILNCNDNQSSTSTNDIQDQSFKIIYDDGKVQPFAPEIFSRYTNVRDVTISANQDEAYFTLLSTYGELSVIMLMRMENGSWSEPEIASFSGRYTDLEPFLSPDGLELYFASNRPISKDSTAIKDFDIWYVKRDKMDLEWSQPINIGAPINSTFDEFYPSVTHSKNLYFTAIKEDMDGQDDIFIGKWNGESYEQPVALGEGVNTNGAEFNAFVAPDESYIIFSGWRRPDGVGSGDLYISHRENKEWQAATNLTKDINSKYIDYCPFVHVESGTLYFTSRRSNIINKDSVLRDYNELIKEINRYDNGSSRLYKTDIKSIINKAKN